MSTTSADPVIADTVETARAILGSDIEAVFTLGSLAHGGFAPLVSDVDVAIVLATTGPQTADRIACVQNAVTERASSPLSSRLSLFWGDWELVRSGRGPCGRLGPVDRLDLLESGRLLEGTDRREPSERPSARELVLMSADHIASRFTDEHLERLWDTPSLLAGGPRAVTKAVLFPVRFAYTLRTGRIGLNEAAAHWYAAEDLPGSGLALQALQWRGEGIADEDQASTLLETDLAAIHAACFDDYVTELDALGEPSRASALAETAARVRVATPDAR